MRVADIGLCLSQQIQSVDVRQIQIQQDQTQRIELLVNSILRLCACPCKDKLIVIL